MQWHFKQIKSYKNSVHIFQEEAYFVKTDLFLRVEKGYQKCHCMKIPAIFLCSSWYPPHFVNLHSSWQAFSFKRFIKSLFHISLYWRESNKEFEYISYLYENNIAVLYDTTLLISNQVHDSIMALKI